MNQKENNLEFKKSLNRDSSNKLSNHQNQRDIVKARIMDKYNVSLKEADRILFEIEEMQKKNKFPKKGVVNKSQINYSNSNSISHSKKVLNSNGNTDVITPQHVLNRKTQTRTEILDNNSNDKLNSPILEKKQQYHKQYSSNDKSIGLQNQKDSVQNNELNVNQSNFKNIQKTKVNSYKQKDINHDSSDNTNSTTQKNIHSSEINSEKNVDSILEDILPDYKQQISINVDHVDLTFEVEKEKIDTLKETFIRTLKRKKSEKIKIHALNDVSFKIYKGEKVGIIGYNGAGKSTLLRTITGIYLPDKGNVTTYGNISPLLSLGAGFDPNFSGRKNILLNGAVLGYDKDFLESKMDEIIEFSELGEFIDIPIKNYSSGMLAKLGFSIATSVNPDILIIDEILGVGDVNFSKKSADKIKSLMDGGTTVLLVSHSLPRVIELCDKAIWIDNGRVRAIGEINKVCGEYLKDAEKASAEQLANIKLVN